MLQRYIPGTGLGLRRLEVEARRCLHYYFSQKQSEYFASTEFRNIIETKASGKFHAITKGSRTPCMCKYIYSNISQY
jgi:hypothetical protein